MKLLMISTDRKIFEEGSAVRLRMAEYARNFDEMHIIVFSPSSYREIFISSNCWAYPTRSRSKWLYPLDAIRLGRFIISRRGITEITCQDPFLTAMAGISLKNQFNIPLEIQVHTDIGSPYFTKSFGNRLRKSLALSYLWRADLIRVVSKKIKEYLIGTLGIPEVAVEVRPISVDTVKIKDSPILPAADLRITNPQFSDIVLMASRLEREKNIQLAIKAWPAVLEKIPTAGLLIVGSGSEGTALSNLVEKLGLSKSIVFEKWADQATLMSYYKTASLFLNTSWYEGYGMTLVEAKSAGCLVVSTDVGVAREIGAVITSFDFADVARAILSALRLKGGNVRSTNI